MGGPCEQPAVVFLWWGTGKASGPLEGRKGSKPREVSSRSLC